MTCSGALANRHAKSASWQRLRRRVAAAVLAVPFWLMAASAQADSVLAQATAQVDIGGYGQSQDEFVENDLLQWLAGTQTASASARMFTPFGEMGGDANGSFTTGGGGGSFHLYASAFTSDPSAYAFADGSMTMHYRAAYEVLRGNIMWLAVPAAGSLSAISYAPAMPGEVFASASTQLSVDVWPLSGGAVLSYSGAASFSAVELGQPGVAELAGDWVGDGRYEDDYTFSVSALDFLLLENVDGSPMTLEPGWLVTVDYTVSVLTHATRTNFVNHVATADFRGTTELQFLHYDPLTGDLLSGDVLRPVPLPVPELGTAPMILIGLLALIGLRRDAARRRRP